MSPRRELTVAVLASAAGAALVLLAGSRVWRHLVTERAAPLPPLTQGRTGSALQPWLPALALVAFAGAGALLATRGGARLAVGGLIALCGAAAVGTAAVAAAGSNGWPLVAIGGGLLVLAAGVAAVVRGVRWPSMGARYDRSRPVPPSASGPGLWDALDRGEDPTYRGEEPT